MGRIGFTRHQLEEAIGQSRTWAETLRALGYCISGGNHATVKKYAREWGIDSSHFSAQAVRDETLRRANEPRPLDEILVAGSRYSRGSLKRRLYEAGLKKRVCELCGQGDQWQGQPMSLILDHINGVRNDNRLENLRIVCPNCAATLSTHCGRGKRPPSQKRQCEACSEWFYPRHASQQVCSRACVGALHTARNTGRPIPATRRVERPPYEQLIAEIEATSYSAVGRKYGVSDNAIRKWVRWYEVEQERSDSEREGADALAA